MFSRKKNSPQKRIDCLISSGTIVGGDLVFSGGLRIDGIVQGNISVHDGKSGTLIVSEHARVEGTIDVTHAVINGEVCGPLLARDFLRLETHARIAGDITYQVLEMHHGAVVSGQLIHQAHNSDTSLPAASA